MKLPRLPHVNCIAWFECSPSLALFSWRNMYCVLLWTQSRSYKWQQRISPLSIPRSVVEMKAGGKLMVLWATSFLRVICLRIPQWSTGNVNWADAIYPASVLPLYEYSHYSQKKRTRYPKWGKTTWLEAWTRRAWASCNESQGLQVSRYWQSAHYTPAASHEHLCILCLELSLRHFSQFVDFLYLNACDRTKKAQTDHQWRSPSPTPPSPSRWLSSPHCT